MTPPEVAVFCAYAHEDSRFRVQLFRHMKGLERQKVIKTWYDGEIKPGARWDAAINGALRAADIILLLLSADFVASDYIYEVELERAVERESEGAKVVPIVLKNGPFKGFPFFNLQALPKHNDQLKPVTSWGRRDDAYASIAEAVRDMATTISQQRGSGRPREPQATRVNGHNAYGFWDVPERNPNLVGRDGLIGALSALFGDGQSGSVVALVGSGGVGKSSVASAFAHAQRGAYDLVAWLTAEKVEALHWKYALLADRIGLAPSGQEAARTALREWLVAHDRWLLVFDNAVAPAHVRACLPDVIRGHVLVTSREPGWGVLAQELPVNVLTIQHSVEYLRAQTHDADGDAAKQLATLLRGVPRALETAAATIRQDHGTMAGYLSEIQTTL